ncbi:MAG: PBP1A family penicillin-binding protein [Spirochaetes bacterium]|nr:PBP1A family penicillin-binding protein [Spirochaetota bacterium]
MRLLKSIFQTLRNLAERFSRTRFGKWMSSRLHDLHKKYDAMTVKKIERFFFTSIIVGAIVAGIALGLLVAALRAQPDIARLENYKPTIPTKILDINSEVIAEIFEEKRELIEYDDIPPHLINAIIAMEDNNFYTHTGVDFWGILRSAFIDIITLSKRQGGSTLTQQLARNIFLGRKKTFYRKIQEAWCAFQIERKYTKKEILTLYFNQIYFGHSAYGVHAASRFYFGKHVKDLTLAECALLATLPKAPNEYSPVNNIKKSMQRHRVVLRRMAELGYINDRERHEVYNAFWTEYQYRIKKQGATAYSDSVNNAPYFAEYIRQILESKFGAERVRNEGMKVYTTLNLRKQKAAEETLMNGLAEQNEFYSRYSAVLTTAFGMETLDSADLLTTIFNIPLNIGESKISAGMQQKLNSDVLLPVYQVSLIMGVNDVSSLMYAAMQEEDEEIAKKVEGAIVAMDPRTGYIEVMVGGSGFTPNNQLNRTMQAYRQAGSVFKPFLYAKAIESRQFTASSELIDAPVAYPISDGEMWVPKNYSGDHRGPVPLRTALKNSINVISVKLLDAIGVDNLISFVKPILNAETAADVRRMFPKNLTLALGTGVYTPLELANGFAVFANGGEEVHPIAIRYIADRNDKMIENVEEEMHKKYYAKGGRKRLVEPESAYIITDMLKDVVASGTASASIFKTGFKRPAAGKTGTTTDWRDAWFIGYTPQLVACVWMGFDKNDFSLGKDRAGGQIAAPIWGEFMKRALARDKVMDFKQPQDVIRVRVCAKSGLIPTEKCATIIDECFIRNTSPLDACTRCSMEQEQTDWSDTLLEKYKKKTEKKRSLKFEF